eukprot:gene11239-23500_t
MKFGQYLIDNKNPEWRTMYLDYDKLREMIKALQFKNVGPVTTGKGIALTVPLPTNAAGMPIDRAVLELTQEQFYSFLEQEMRKIEQFTKKMVREIRDVLHSVEIELRGWKPGGKEKNAKESEILRAKVDKAADEFLKLEKYVNLNFLGFHKILKKHDRHLPNPCKAFYISRLHDQNWVRGDYSDVIVMLSRVYSSIRGDAEVKEKESEKQDFVRSTTKYWVHTEDISRVKYIVLQHLPVFLQKTMEGETDSQLVNSVYLDNRAMELYHGRLDKTPGAIALRFRWYGTGTPEIVFVERKTHRESWCGELSVKERFIIPEKKVPLLLSGKFNIDEELKRMREKGKKEEDIAEWLSLATEVTQAINSKMLEPTMRTQYMRTAFQIPFDATVRISLDTNLTMISERTEESMRGERWFRDPDVNVPQEEITRFPHAVLEVKLQLEEEGTTPDWVTELIESGMLMQVHKFSKFIHGCATIMPEEVQAVPYWIDDVTLADSISQTEGAKLLIGNKGQTFEHLIPHDKEGGIKGKAKPAHKAPVSHPSSALQSKPRISADSTSIPIRTFGLCDYCDREDEECFCSSWNKAAELNEMNTQKVEPKLVFANERTYMSWLSMAVILSASSMGILAFTKETGGRAELFALMILPIALAFIVYAVTTYLWRMEKIRLRESERWDDPYGPVILTLVVILALVIQFVIK